jgi:hypothetical protein
MDDYLMIITFSSLVSLIATWSKGFFIARRYLGPVNKPWNALINIVHRR